MSGTRDFQQPLNALSKSQFQLFRDAPRHLWAAAHLPEIWPEPSAFEQHSQEQGYSVEVHSQEWLTQRAVQKFPSHLNPSKTSGKWHWQDSFSSTDSEGNAFFCRTDAWWEDPKSTAIHLFEIKSSTRVKYDALVDLAFQTAVIQDAHPNRPVESIWLLHLNKEYVRAGALDFDQLFTLVEVTEQVRELLPEIRAERARASEVLASTNSDEWLSCTRPKTCPCPSICHPNLKPYSVYDLPGLRHTTLELIDRGIESLVDVPDNFSLETKQRRMVQAVKSGQPVIDRHALAQSLETLTFPLCFLDYEAYSSALPLYDGCVPQQQVVFQYSLHVVPDKHAMKNLAHIRHYEHISFGPGDPSREVVQHMQASMPKTGSVIVWNQSFEASRNREMAEGMLDAKEFLLGLNNRMYDLAEVFRRGMYVDREFHGSWSIKNVLPILVPELRYDTLEIHKGDQALLAWWSIVSGEISDTNEIKHIRKNLLTYCQLDTWAMVKIWEVLEDLFTPTV